MNDNNFNYTYSAPNKSERLEIEEIRNRYAPKQAQPKDDLTRLRELDAKVRRFPEILSLSLGIVGILVFGLGLTMILEWNIVAWSFPVMFLGCLSMFMAYPVYARVLRKNKEKYADEILEISSRLLNENN